MNERPRHSARVLLRNPAADVLLIRFDSIRAGQRWVFWATPGGEVEPGETPAQAAVRELDEELGLQLTLTGPVRTEQNRFEHLGEIMNSTDTFFSAICAREAPHLLGVTAEELKLMKEIRWWTSAAIRSTDEPVFPPWLADWMDTTALKQD